MAAFPDSIIRDMKPLMVDWSENSGDSKDPKIFYEDGPPDFAFDGIQIMLLYAPHNLYGFKHDDGSLLFQIDREQMNEWVPMGMEVPDSRIFVGNG